LVSHVNFHSTDCSILVYHCYRHSVVLILTASLHGPPKRQYSPTKLKRVATQETIA
jgi:hypothetical protein